MAAAPYNAAAPPGSMFLLDSAIFPWDLAILTMLAFGLSLGILCMLWRRKHPKSAPWKRMTVGLLGFLSFLGFLVVFYGSFIEPRIILVTERAVPFPAFNSLKIAVISDLHVGPYKDRRFVERIVQKTNALFPDLILLVGDFLYDDRSDMEQLEPLKNLRAALGTYAVTGNHDAGHFMTVIGRLPVTKLDRSGQLTDYLTSLGIRVLRNGKERILLPNEDIIVAGVDELWSASSSLDDALEGIPADAPVILLAHQPDVILDTLSHRANLIVSGHTHGGQIRLPFYGAVPPIPTKLGKEFDQGLFRVGNNTQLAITRGAGETGARARLFAWPEILLLRTTQK